MSKQKNPPLSTDPKKIAATRAKLSKDARDRFRANVARRPGK